VVIRVFPRVSCSGLFLNPPHINSNLGQFQFLLQRRFFFQVHGLGGLCQQSRLRCAQ